MKSWCCACMVAAWWCVAARATTECDFPIGGHDYTGETLVRSVWLAGGLAVDYNTHNLYFSYYNKTEDRYKNAKVNIRNKAFTVIEELRGRCWYTVDRTRGHVHAGCPTEGNGSGGLHTLDSNSGQFEPAREAGLDVAFVHHHGDTLYYSAYPERSVQTFTFGRSARTLPPAREVAGLVVDTQGRYIFINSTGVYRRWGDGEEAKYPGLDRWVFAVAADRRGAAYTCDISDPRGVRLLQDASSPTVLLNVYCCGLTFDGDSNMIYADWDMDTIVRLVPC